MRIEITVQAFDDLTEGSPVVWGYHHQEQIPQELTDGVDFGAVLRGERGFTEEENRLMDEIGHQNSSALLEEMMKRVDEARESIIRQAAAGLPRRGDSNIGA
jgi:hypothetical protein